MNIRNYSGKDVSNLVLTFNSTMFTSSAMLEGKLKKVKCYYENKKTVYLLNKAWRNTIYP